MRASTRTIAVGCAAALTLALTACAADDSAAPPAPAGSTSAPTDAADPAQPTELSLEDFNRVTSAAMLDESTFRYATSTEGGEVDLSYAYDVVREDDGGVRIAMSYESQGIDVTTIMADGLYYMNLGDLSEGRYVVVDPADTSNPFAGQLPDPDQLAKVGQGGELDDSVTELEAVGVEEVAGAPAMHYVLTLDTAAYVEALSGQGGGALLDEALAALPPTMTSEAWLDAENRMVKTVSEFQGVTTTLVYSDWGDESVVVDTPPVEEQIDWTEVEALA